MVYGLPPSTRLLNSGDGCCWGLPVLAHEVSKHAWGLGLRRVRVGLAVSPFALWPSASRNSVGSPDQVISQLNILPACAPANASSAPLRQRMHDSGSGWFATPF